MASPVQCCSNTFASNASCCSCSFKFPPFGLITTSASPIKTRLFQPKTHTSKPLLITIITFCSNFYSVQFIVSALALIYNTMADQHPQGDEKEPAMKDDCGIFAFLGKNEGNQEEDKPTLVEELHRSHSSSSSSSDGGGREGKKKKKGLKEKIKDKMVSRGDEVTEHKDSPTAVEKHEEVLKADTAHPEEKKGILEKIKEKLPGQHKKDEEEGSPATPPEGEPKEKKGILEKIKEKLPGHNKNGEDAKDKHN